VELIKIKEKKWVIGLILLFILYFLVNSYVLHKDNFSPVCDSANTILSAFRAASSITSSHIVDLHSISHDMSPLLSFLLMLNILVFGGNIDILMHTNLLFLVILMYSLYNLGKRIGDKSLGFAAVVVCLSFPAVFGMSRIMWHEFPLMCIMTLSYYLLFKTDYFKNTKYSFLWALTIACGFLIKFTLPIYIFVPVLIYIIKSFLEKGNRKQLVTRLLLCFLIVLSITGWWVLLHANVLIKSRWDMVLGVPVNLFDRIRDAYLFLCCRCVYPPFFLLFIVSFPLLLRKPMFEKSIIMIGTFVPIAIFLIAPHASGFGSSRYFVPILPLIALSIANLIFLFTSKFSRCFVLLVLIILCAVQFLFLNMGIVKPIIIPEDVLNDTVEAIIAQGKIVPYISKIDPNEILDILNTRKTQKEISILFLGDFTYVDTSMQIQALKKGYQLSLFTPVQQIKGGSQQSVLDDPKLLDNAEFIFVVENDKYSAEYLHDIHGEYCIPYIIASFNQKRDNYTNIANFTGKADAKIALFQKNPVD